VSTFWFVLAAVFAPIFAFYCVIAVRGLRRFSKQRPVNAAMWADRWGSRALRQYERAGLSGGLGMLLVSVFFLLLLLGAPLWRPLYGVGAAVGGVACVLVVISSTERIRSMRSIVKFQQLPKGSLNSMPRGVLRDPATFDAWVATRRRP
jgi:hypothetical protein